MNDRQLLAQAANAAGIPAYDIIYGKNQWNPLVNDGDALRLAVQLGIFVRLHHINETDDPYAATRRAIVEAAAQIGGAE